MAPFRTPNRRGRQPKPPAPAQSASAGHGPPVPKPQIFVDNMLGEPMSLHIEGDVEDRDDLVKLVQEHGGVVAAGYASVPYIIVDPLKESGRSLFLQFTGKRGKVVLAARWIHECIKAGQVEAFPQNWAGCRVTGTERGDAAAASAATSHGTPRRANVRTSQIEQAATIPPRPQAAVRPTSSLAGALAVPHGHAPYQRTFPVAEEPATLLPTPSAAPPQTWQASNGISLAQTRVYGAAQAQVQAHHASAWGASPYGQPHASTSASAAASAVGAGPSRTPYRWDEPADDQYDYSQHDSTYYPDGGGVDIDDASSSGFRGASADSDPDPPSRGRRRTRGQGPPPAPPAATLVVSNVDVRDARSPTPPRRVVKNLGAGNLYTAEDVIYLKKYIDYVKQTGQVLSIREICERLAVKAPQHSFYSWRQYCTNNKIRLAGYVLTNGSHDGTVEIDSVLPADVLYGPGNVLTVQQQLRAEGDTVRRDRSPTPPRALYRSTTGKGVAFTDEDMRFLIRFLEYRQAHGRADMTAFWTDVATRAPHHSRASWMKFYRRHKHELYPADVEVPDPPPPPPKKLPYFREDDIRIARYFMNRPAGTAEEVYQEFARMYPYHPWKGWQEHHRKHKKEIDSLIERLANGETFESDILESTH